MKRDPVSVALGRPTRLELGSHVLDLARRELLDAAGQPAPLRTQAREVLCVLAAHAGERVDKDELIRAVWGDVVVTDDSLVQAVGDIRRVLGDGEHRIVRTVHRRGYMLVVPPGGAPPGAAAGDDFEPAPAPAPASPHTTTLRAASTATRPAVTVSALFGVCTLLLVIAALAWAAHATWSQRGAPLTSLAILPFEAEPAGGAEDWFVDALGADLHATVARWTQLHLVGHGTMVRRYKPRPGQADSRTADPQRVASEVGVTYVLAGRARRVGDQVRLNLELVDGRSGRAAWSQAIEIHRAELPRAIADVAGSVAKTVYIQLGQAVGERIARLAPEQVEADDLAMHGFAIFLRDVAPEGFARAKALFEQALARDPRCVRALGGASLVNTMSVIFEFAPDSAERLRRAEELLAQLEQAAPEHQLTWYARAALVYPRADWRTLLAVSEQTVARFPNDPTSHHYRCSALLRLARTDESIAACQRALAISPFDSRAPIWQGLIGFNHFIAGRYGAAAEHAQRMVSGNRRLPFYQLLLAGALARDGRDAEARQWLAEFRKRSDAFDSAHVAKMWPATEPGFVEGRDRLIATLRALGLP